MTKIMLLIGHTTYKWNYWKFSQEAIRWHWENSTTNSKGVDVRMYILPLGGIVMIFCLWRCVLQLSSSMIISPICTRVYTPLKMQSYVSPSWYFLVEGNIYFHLPTHHLYTGVTRGDLDLDLLRSCDRVGHWSIVSQGQSHLHADSDLCGCHVWKACCDGGGVTKRQFKATVSHLRPYNVSPLHHLGL